MVATAANMGAFKTAGGSGGLDVTKPQRAASSADRFDRAPGPGDSAVMPPNEVSVSRHAVPALAAVTALVLVMLAGCPLPGLTPDAGPSSGGNCVKLVPLRMWATEPS